MTRPLYDNGLPNARLEPNGHKGLWYSHFFNGYPVDWKPDRDKETKKQWAADKTKWVKGVSGPAGDSEACMSAVMRLHNLCTQQGGKTRIFTGTWHFATGMGLPHPVENGFLWHPTLGSPYLPGAAVKGLVRAWLESWIEFDDNDSGRKKRWEKLYRWFGSEAKDPKERKQAREAGFTPSTRSKDTNPDTEAGGFIFFDALPVTPPGLKADIMTPHMGKWYELGGEPVSDAGLQAERTPADWHDPNPVVFLVADKPSFQFAVAPRLPQFKQEISEVMAVLQQALDWLGAGAKTAVGYGQFEISNESLGPRHTWLIEQIPVLMKANNEPKSENIWGGKSLATAWHEIGDPGIKAAVLEEIQAYWQEKGWWENPPKGAKRKAKAIYLKE